MARPIVGIGAKEGIMGTLKLPREIAHELTGCHRDVDGADHWSECDGVVAAIEEVRQAIAEVRKECSALVEERDAFKMQLLGALGLLAHCSLMLRPRGEEGNAGETREMICAALDAAKTLIPNLGWKMVLDRIEVSVL